MAIPGVGFRQLVDEAGDSATHFAFFLRDREHCQRVNEVLRQEGAGAINFSENTWHYYARWEHLLGGKTLASSGYPFFEPGGRRRLLYDPQALPQTAALLQRTLVCPVSIRMSEEKLAQMCRALQLAAKA